LNWELR